MSVVIVVIGKAGTPPKDYRLSTLIASVSDSTTEYVADPATSIAAEAFSANDGNYANNKVFSADDLAAVLAAAQTFVENNPDADYSITSGDIIAGTKFGQSDSLNSGAAGISAVIDAVQAIDSNLAVAKNMVNQIQEAGMPLRAMVSPENLDFRDVLTDDVLMNYQTVMEGAGKLLLPAVGSGGTTLGGDHGGLDISQLTVGHAYEVTGVNSDGRLELTDTGAGTAGQITMTYDMTSADPSGIYTVVAKHVGSNWEITQTFSGDTAQDYKLTVSDNAFLANHGLNPTMGGTLSMKDKNFATPITFVGSISEVRQAGSDDITSATATGTLTTPLVTNTGTYSVQFATSKPSGAAAWQKIRDFPTRMTLTNSKTELLLSGGKKITISCNASSTTQFLTDDGYVSMEPNDIQFSGSYVNTNTGLDFSGDASFSATWVTDGHRHDVPTASAHLKGELKKDAHPTYSVDITCAKTANNISADLSLAAGVNTLTGHGTSTLNTGTGISVASLTLTSSTGAVILLNQDSSDVRSGSITVGVEKVADISEVDHMIRIVFKDSTFKEFPL